MLTLHLEPAELDRQIALVRALARLPRLKPADRSASLNLLRLLMDLQNAAAVAPPPEEVRHMNAA